MKALAIPGSENAKGRLAQSRCLLQHRVEHRSEVAGRAVDDLQYLGGRGLLIQGLAGLGDQPRVLHRDHRLRGEVLQQRDLLFREWPYFLTSEGRRAGQETRPPESQDQYRPNETNGWPVAGANSLA